MFEVKIKNHGKIRVVFEHYNPERIYTLVQGTICRLKDKNKETIFSGRTVLAREDRYKYDKEFGRKLSLTRAIAGLPRSERTKIWKAYFEAKKKNG